MNNHPSKNNPVCCEKCVLRCRCMDRVNHPHSCVNAACPCHKEWKVLKDTDTEHIAVLVSPKTTAPDAWEKEFAKIEESSALSTGQVWAYSAKIRHLIPFLLAQARADTVAEVLGSLDFLRSKTPDEVPQLNSISAYHLALNLVSSQVKAISRLVDREETV